MGHHGSGYQDLVSSSEPLMSGFFGFVDATVTVFPLIAAVALVLTALIFAGAVMLGLILLVWDWLEDVLDPVFETVQDLIGRHIRR